MSVYAKPEQKQARNNSIRKKETEKRVATPNQTGIPDAMKTRFENLSGFSFDDVRVHYNSGKPAQLQALAYTQGNQVYVGPGQERHLGHELGHVVQQKASKVKATSAINGQPLNDHPHLEKEADNLSSRDGSSGAAEARSLEATANTNTLPPIQKCGIRPSAMRNPDYIKTLKDAGSGSDPSGTFKGPGEKDPLRGTEKAQNNGEMHHIIPVGVAHRVNANQDLLRLIPFFTAKNINEPWNLIELDGAPDTKLMNAGAPYVYHRTSATTYNHNAYSLRVYGRRITSTARALEVATGIRNQIVTTAHAGVKRSLDTGGYG